MVILYIKYIPYIIYIYIYIWYAPYYVCIYNIYIYISVCVCLCVCSWMFYMETTCASLIRFLFNVSAQQIWCFRTPICENRGVTVETRELNDGIDQENRHPGHETHLSCGCFWAATAADWSFWWREHPKIDWPAALRFQDRLIHLDSKRIFWWVKHSGAESFGTAKS